MSELLRDHSILRGGTGFPESHQGQKEGEIPFVKVSDMSLPGNKKFITTANNFIDHGVAAKLGAVIFPPGTTVFAKVGAALLLNRRRILTRPTVIDNNMMGATATDVDEEFLYHFLCSIDFGDFVQSGALPSVNQQTLGDISVPQFSLAQQRRIAEILSVADETIEQTEALIVKTQQIKAGLMHDLFTRGVTADGRLRPVSEEAPQLYKQSLLGWIPKEWQAAKLANIGKWISGGTPPKARTHLWGGDLPWITPKDMKVFRIESTQDSLTQHGADCGSRIAPKDSVFIVVRGMILAHTFPVCIARMPMAFNQDVKALVPGAEASGEFLAHWFTASKDRMLSLVTEATHGTKRIDMRDLLRSHIGLPPVSEQTRLVSILNEIDAIIDSAGHEVSKLRKIKSGLMDDLLTGRVELEVGAETRSPEVAASV